MNKQEEMKINNKLSPDRSIYNLLGCICNDLDIIRNTNFKINVNDFPKSFHKTIFTAIHNLSEVTESNTLTEKNIDDYLSQMPQYYKSFKDNQGLQYIFQAKETADENMIENNIQSVKKFSLLRTLALNGFDISNVYDYDSLDEEKKTKQREQLEKMTRNDIIELYSDKIVDIQLEYQDNQLELSNFMIGDDLDSFIEEMKKEPDLGYSFRLDEYNGLFRGMRKGKLLLRSGASGTGKTRHMLADALNVATDEQYINGKWIKKDKNYPCLFISTELSKREVQAIALSYITNIPPQVILDGYYDQPTDIRVKKGIEVLKKSPLHMAYVEDFTINDIENIINYYIKKEKVEYVFFDYIQITPALKQEMSKAFKDNLREDQVMSQFTGKLKQIAEKYNVFIESATQLNRNANDNTKRDAEALRGGYATADKIDYGIIISNFSKEDKKWFGKELAKHGYKEPNFSHWVYKNRAGQAGVVIWTRINKATMREEFCFATDYSLQPIEIDAIKISSVDEDVDMINNTNNKW